MFFFLSFLSSILERQDSALKLVEYLMFFLLSFLSSILERQVSALKLA